MYFIRRRTVLLALTVSLLLTAATSQAQTTQEALQTPEGLIEKLYETVSWEAGGEADFDLVRSLFLEQAIVVLRSSRTATTVFDLDGFIGDFVNFKDNTPAGANGFAEQIIRMASTEMGDIAHVFVLYDAQIIGSNRPPTRGVDSIQLIKKDGRWWIVSVTNELPMTGAAIPGVLLQ